jgi:GNAT superfamily N-acetyltransferase
MGGSLRAAHSLEKPANLASWPHSCPIFITDRSGSPNSLSGLPASAKFGNMSKNNAPLIRALRPDDRSAWAGLWRDYLAYYETSVPDEVYDSTFARLLSGDAHEFHALVAETDGALVGLTHYLFHRHAWRIENVCYLQDLYAHSDARGTGIGRALIEAVYAAADANGTPNVYWLTQDFNAPARQLYDRIGVLTPFIRYNRP